MWFIDVIICCIHYGICCLRNIGVCFGVFFLFFFIVMKVIRYYKNGKYVAFVCLILGYFKTSFVIICLEKEM